MGENEELIYKKITAYYDIAEMLRVEIVGLEDVSEKEKEEVLFPIVDTIRESADAILEKYVIYIKNPDNAELRDEIIEILDDLVVAIDDCKNKIYELYKDR